MHEKNHTASKNVHVIDNAFPISILNRTRRIWIYLPEGYAASEKRYPVLYMHDGQNLFDEATSFSGEWEVDKTLDALPDACIVVGIDNGGLKRMNEYNPHTTHQFGKGEGKQYLEFIVKALKPYIDKHYRTLRSKRNTFMAGSSMGGLITFYAGIYYPDVFSRMAIFSPSFWAAAQISHEIKKYVKPRSHSRHKYYFYAGGSENVSMVSDMLQVAELIKVHSGAKMKVVIRPDGRHNEQAWKEEFPVFYQWMMGS